MAHSSSILIVEDETDLLDLLALAVTSSGFKVHKAVDGFKALAIIQVESIDLVLCDLNMPGMNGIAFLSIVRAANNKVPFIFITGEDAESTALMTQHLDVAAFLQKPFDLRAVRALINGKLGPDQAA